MGSPQAEDSEQPPELPKLRGLFLFQEAGGPRVQGISQGGPQHRVDGVRSAHTVDPAETSDLVAVLLSSLAACPTPFKVSW